MEGCDSQGRRKIRKSGARPRHVLLRDLRQYYGCAAGRRRADLDGATMSVNESPEQVSALSVHSSSFKNTIPLRPGYYRVEMAVKDVNEDKTGTWVGGIRVPD